MDFSDQWEALIIEANRPATCTDKDSADRRQVMLGRREFDELCAAAYRRGMKEAAQQAAQQLEDRAARFPKLTIFNGKIMRDELRMHARKFRALADQEPSR